MDFLNKASAQFNDLFRSMSHGGRITAGLLLIVAVVSVGYLFQSQVSGGDEPLFAGQSIDTPTLQKMEEAFGTAGLNGFTIEGGQVKVPRSQRAAYLAALADKKALPANWGDKMKSTTDSGMFDDPGLREMRRAEGIMEEMSMVITSMKGIERASVIIDSQKQNGLNPTPLKTASVAVQAIGGVPLDDDQVDKIRYYVSGGIIGMKPENVTIADANGRIHPGNEAGNGGPDGDPYARAVRKAEQDLNAKIRESLAYIQNLTVTSTVVLDHDKGTRIVENKLDPKTVTLKQIEDSHTTNRESAAAGGPPGLQPQGGGVNQPMALNAAGGKNNNETSEDTKNEQLNDASSVLTEKETYGLAPKSAKVSVGIPASYYDKLWRQQNPVKEGEEAKKPDEAAIAKIREEITQDVRLHVATLLPIAPDVKDPSALVTVTTFQDLKLPEITGPAVTQRVVAWLAQNWTMAATVGLVLVSVTMLRSVLRGVPGPAPEPATMAARISANENKPEEKEELVEIAAARRLRRMTGGGPSLRDELSEMVKEDPDSAANILRTWIGQVT